LTSAVEVTGLLHPFAVLPPEKEPQVTIVWEAGWAPEPVWTLEKSIYYKTGIENTRGIHSLVYVAKGKNERGKKG
jgi:hypothetical protein